ncbi:hypothetical protein K461DRAFT_292686 [Myriangium duriaei CBS 260.36]|uniref:Uncharacterized protein n=1 Tax=Myriangium duriaei CBS 260.36 TaxID=1168546 RepID=A0A9P4MNR8_9PEZI|nr:hypothetical protein K461DRAFT_292686 [Myriangium duriaei CBS 260.36]
MFRQIYFLCCRLISTVLSILTALLNIHFPIRLHLFEWGDLNLTPTPLKHLAQSTLTAQWLRRLPLLQSAPPATHATRLLQRVFANISDSDSVPYTVVDFCSGAGGPVPAIESALNAHRSLPIMFRVSDLHPDIDAWIELSSRSENLGFFPQPVDARRLPAGARSVARREEVQEERLEKEGPWADEEVWVTGQVSALPERRVERRRDAGRKEAGVTAETKVLHLFCLAFHHFRDAEATGVVAAMLEAADAFVVVELQDRSVGCLAMMMLEGLVVLAVSWWWFWGEWGRLLLTYVLPVLPVMHTWDGLVSCLRTRTFEEMRALIDGVLEEDRRVREKEETITRDAEAVRSTNGLGDWTISQARVKHTWPCGYLHATIGIRKEIRKGME